MRRSKLLPLQILECNRSFITFINNIMLSFEFALLLGAVGTAVANTEKVIFIAPEDIQIPLEHPTLEDLQLDSISPQHWSLRTYVSAAFPTDSFQNGLSSWFLLHRLKEGQRYEVRICWAATVRPSDLTTVYTKYHIATNFLPTRYTRSPDCLRNTGFNLITRSVLRASPTESDFAREWEIFHPFPGKSQIKAQRGSQINTSSSGVRRSGLLHYQ
jgi:hypothetical protein